MAGFGAETRRYLKRLHKAGEKVPEIIAETAEVATLQQRTPRRMVARQSKGQTQGRAHLHSHGQLTVSLSRWAWLYQAAVLR